MQLHHLEAFLAVADRLHFGRAGERLHVAQPPLSRMIKQLEREVGAPLFERTTRSMRVTAAGQALVSPANDVLEDVRVVCRAVRSAGRWVTVRGRLGFAGPSSHALVGQLSRAVREHHPGIELLLRSTTCNYEALLSPWPWRARSGDRPVAHRARSCRPSTDRRGEVCGAILDPLAISVFAF